MDHDSVRSTVWIVDDEDDVRDALGAFLVSVGFVVRDFPNGSAAWEAFSREPLPDAIILDHDMPVMNGVAFRQRQIADSRVRDIPVILYTAGAGSELPGVLVMSKTVHPEALRSVLHNLCAPRAETRARPVRRRCTSVA